MTNTSSVGGTPPPPNPNTYSTYGSATSDFPIGSPLTSKVNAQGHDSAQLAAARAEGLASVTGLGSTPSPAGGRVKVQFAGPLTLTEAQWAEVVTNLDNSHALEPHTDYYLSETDGQIQNGPPTTPGAFVVRVGRAISETTLVINVGPPAEIS